MTSFEVKKDQIGSDSMRWNGVENHGRTPLWVADTDFVPPKEVAKALDRVVRGGMFSYVRPPEELKLLIKKRCAIRYNWAIQTEWLVFIPSVMNAINVAFQALLPQNSGVITSTPCFGKITKSVIYSGRQLIEIPMYQHADRWLWDLDLLESKAKQAKMIVLCHPHNPTGAILPHKQLKRLAEIVNQHKLIVCSDEVHCDTLFNHHTKHLPFAAIDSVAAQQTLTLMSPAKAYNLAGINAGVAIIPNLKMRQQFVQHLATIAPHVGGFGYHAMFSAYKHGEHWLEQQQAYLKQNLALLVEGLKDIREITFIPPQASFLVWLDVRGLQLNNPAHWFEQAGLTISPGEDFGAPGFVRVNIGVHRETLALAIDKLRNVVLHR